MLYNYLWFFMIYSFGGWVAEVMFHAVTMGKVINRGFLCGPVCPIYGFGMIFIVNVYNLFGSVSIGLDFLIGIVLATAIELFGGWLLYTIFQTRWWDYSDRRFQYKGYICLEFSLIWGFAATFVIELVHPGVEKFVGRALSGLFGMVLLVICILTYVADLIVTVVTVCKFNNVLAQLTNLGIPIRYVSDSLSTVIGEATIDNARKIGEGRVQVALAKAEIKDERDAVVEKLRKKATSGAFFGPRRLLRAFPNMMNTKYTEAFRVIRDSIRKN